MTVNYSLWTGSFHTANSVKFALRFHRQPRVIALTVDNHTSVMLRNGGDKRLWGLSFHPTSPMASTHVDVTIHPFHLSQNSISSVLAKSRFRLRPCGSTGRLVRR